MENKICIQSENIYLRRVDKGDATEDYLSWINDPEVTKYTESRFSEYTLKDVQDYIESESKSKDSIFLAIVYKKDNKHIGNLKMHRIDRIHKNAEVSILVGEKSYWGKGIGREALKLVMDYAFESLDLCKLYAKCYSNNFGSIKAFQGAGFVIEGVQKKQYFSEGEHVDGVLLGIVKE